MIRTETVPRAVRTVFANGLTVLGVTVFGWSASALLVVYWVEAGIAMTRGMVQGLFARHEPAEVDVPFGIVAESLQDKRGSVSFGPLPPLYPRNVSVVLTSGFVLLVFWPLSGLVVLASAVGSTLPVGTILLAIVVILLGHGLELVDYLESGGYTDDSPREALLRRYVVGVVLLGMFGVFVPSYSSVSVLLVGVVLVKLAIDIATGWLGGTTDSITEWGTDSTTLEIPESEPTAVFQVERRSLLVRSLGLAPFCLILDPYIVFTFAAVIAGLLGGATIGLTAGILTLGVVGVGRIARTDIETGRLEYHVYPERIVAYDRLLDTPQWAVNRRMITGVTVESSLLDWVRPGSQTVVVSIYEERRVFKSLRRPEQFVEVLSDTE